MRGFVQPVLCVCNKIEQNRQVSGRLIKRPWSRRFRRGATEL